MTFKLNELQLNNIKNFINYSLFFSLKNITKNVVYL